MECLILAGCLIILIALVVIYRYIRDVEYLATNGPEIAKENKELRIENGQLHFINDGLRTQIALDKVQIARLEYEVESLIAEAATLKYQARKKNTEEL